MSRFRTLVRLVDMDDHNIYAVLPAWNSEQIVTIPRTGIPMVVMAHLVSDIRVFAKANLGADVASDLDVGDWELPTEVPPVQHYSPRGDCPDCGKPLGQPVDCAAKDAETPDPAQSLLTEWVLTLQADDPELFSAVAQVVNLVMHHPEMKSPFLMWVQDMRETVKDEEE